MTDLLHAITVSEKAEITNSQQGSTSNSVSIQGSNSKQTILRGNEVALSPSCLDYAEDLHAYFLKRPLSIRRSRSISESVEEDIFNADVSKHNNTLIKIIISLQLWGLVCLSAPQGEF